MRGVRLGDGRGEGIELVGRAVNWATKFGAAGPGRSAVFPRGRERVGKARARRAFGRFARIEGRVWNIRGGRGDWQKCRGEGVLFCPNEDIELNDLWVGVS